MTALPAGQRINYFAYGANTNHRHLHNLCPAAEWLGTGYLPNHKLYWRYHLDIQRAPSNVYGTVWSISLNDLLELDAYEGYPHYYTRIKKLIVIGGQTKACWVYMMPKKTELLAPHPDYYNKVLQGYEDSQLPLRQLTDCLPS